MTAMNKAEQDAITNVAQLGDFLFSVLENGTMVYEDLSDELVVEI